MSDSRQQCWERFRSPCMFCRLSTWITGGVFLCAQSFWACCVFFPHVLSHLPRVAAEQTEADGETEEHGSSCR